MAAGVHGDLADLAVEYTLSNMREIHSGWDVVAARDLGSATMVSLIGGRSPPEPLVTTKYESSGSDRPRGKIRVDAADELEVVVPERVRQGINWFFVVSMSPDAVPILAGDLPAGMHDEEPAVVVSEDQGAGA